MKIIAFCFLFIVFLSIESSISKENIFKQYIVDRADNPAGHNIDILHLNGNLVIDGNKNYINGYVDYTFKTFYLAVDSIIFNCSGLNINNIEMENIKLDWKMAGQQLIIHFNKPLNQGTEYQIKIVYDAYPYDGLYFTGWKKEEKYKRKQIWAHSPGGWCPYYNVKSDILTSEFKITFDDKYKVFSNGDRISVVDNPDSTKTWHYKLDKPHVIYLICLVIGDYEVKKFSSNRGLPLEYLYYPDQSEKFETTYKYSKEMFDFLEDETGKKYPWSIYRNIPAYDYLYGGMETTTSTLFGDYMYIEPRAWWMRNYVNVNVHELSHQWFGNYVSNIDKEIWLTESMATYYSKIFEQHIFGNDYYIWVKDQEIKETFDATSRNDFPVGGTLGGRERYYLKGSLIFDMMRYVLGDENFKVSIKHYLDNNQYRVVTYDDLLASIREATGQQMNWFFEQWIFKGGEPHYQVSTKNIHIENKKYTQIDVEQIQQIDNLVGLFKMPIDIEVYYKDGSTKKVSHWIEKKFHSILIENDGNKAVDFVVFDPNSNILKKLTYNRSFDELASQCLKANNLYDRLEALRALKDFPIKMKSNILQKIIENEDYHLIKSEALRQFVIDASIDDEFIPIVKKSISNGDELLVRTVVEEIRNIPIKLKQDYEKILNDSCYKNIELALENLSYCFPNEYKKYCNQIDTLVGWRGRNIQIKKLEIQGLNGEKKAITELIEFSSPSYDFETRINAFSSLMKLNILNEQIAINLFKANLYWHYKLSNKATEVIKYFKIQTKYKKILESSVKSFDEGSQNKIKGWLK